MNDEQRYNEALERARKEYKTHESFNGFRVMLLNIFPELEETDDERIRKSIIGFLITISSLKDGMTVSNEDFDSKVILEWVSWLEKQESVDEIVKRCKTSWYNEGKIQGKMEGLSDDEEYQQGWHDALEKQGEQKPTIQPKFKVGDKIIEKDFDECGCGIIIDIKDGKYIFDDGSFIWIKEQDLWELVDEKSYDKTETKFNVGDWVVRKDGGVFFTDRKFAQITEIDGEKHWFDTGLICLKAEDMRLWTLEDAKDGDILYSKKHNLLWRYKNTKECYCCINLNYNSNNISIGDVIIIPNDVRPATKEQCDLLFDKMLQHTFSEINDKKELKKQGEHNPTDNDDKAESKFHKGDWIVVRGVVILICDIGNDLYDVIFANGEHRVYNTNILDKEAHLWTIADAKDGDVLVASDGSIFIFAGVVDYTCKYYVALTHYNDISVNKEVELGSWELSNHVHPATKEQCDLLFAKMREKGYKWNNEKKEVIGRI